MDTFMTDQQPDTALKILIIKFQLATGHEEQFVSALIIGIEPLTHHHIDCSLHTQAGQLS